MTVNDYKWTAESDEAGRQFARLIKDKDSGKEYQKYCRTQTVPINPEKTKLEVPPGMNIDSLKAMKVELEQLGSLIISDLPKFGNITDSYPFWTSVFSHGTEVVTILGTAEELEGLENFHPLQNGEHIFEWNQTKVFFYGKKKKENMLERKSPEQNLIEQKLEILIEGTTYSLVPTVTYLLNWPIGQVPTSLSFVVLAAQKILFEINNPTFEDIKIPLIICARDRTRSIVFAAVLASIQSLNKGHVPSTTSILCALRLYYEEPISFDMYNFVDCCVCMGIRLMTPLLRSAQDFETNQNIGAFMKRVYEERTIDYDQNGNQVRK